MVGNSRNSLGLIKSSYSKYTLFRSFYNKQKTSTPLGNMLLRLQELGGSWCLTQKTFPLRSRSPVQKPAKARHSVQSRKPTRDGRHRLTASCIQIPTSRRVKKWSVTSCSWGRQRHLSSRYLFNSELEENHHSEVQVRFGLADGNVCGMCRTSPGVIASRGKWLTELCFMKSFYNLINRLTNKTLHFILASFLKKKKSHTILNDLVVKNPVNCLSQYTYYC